jgi:hypothetical protein
LYRKGAKNGAKDTKFNSRENLQKLQAAKATKRILQKTPLESQVAKVFDSPSENQKIRAQSELIYTG